MNKLEVTLQSTFQCHNSQLTYQQELECISQLWFFSPHLLSEFMELEMLSKFCEHVLWVKEMSLIWTSQLTDLFPLNTVHHSDPSSSWIVFPQPAPHGVSVVQQ